MGFATNECAPEFERLVARLVGGNDRDRDVPGRGVVLQPMQDAPAVDVGQEQVERDRGRLELVGKLERRDAQRGHDALESPLARRLQQESRKAEIVLDDQQNFVARLDDVAVIADLVDEPRASLERVGRLWRFAAAIRRPVGHGAQSA